MAARSGLLGMGMALSLALGMVGCRSAADAALDDAAILADVRRGLAEDVRLACSPIRVDVERGEVTLEGRVDRAELKEEAERIARHVEGVDRVTSRIEVADAGLPASIGASPPARP